MRYGKEETSFEIRGTGWIAGRRGTWILGAERSIAAAQKATSE
jgi:hypothetical protein